MILPVHDALRARLATVLGAQYNLSSDALPPITIDYAPNRALGDLALPVAFELARRLRKAPRSIAQELAAALPPVPGIARIEATPNGYLNCFLDRPAFLTERLHLVADGCLTAGGEEGDRRAHGHQSEQGRSHRPPAELGAGRHTRPRPALPGHPGRSAELHRRHRRAGRRRRRWSYRISSRTPSTRCASSPTTSRFDYFCWDLYARVTEWYDAGQGTARDPRARRSTTSSTASTPRAAIAALVADRIVRCHLRTMERMNIEYDLLTWEGDILRLQFWARPSRS